MNIAKFRNLEGTVNDFNMCWDEAMRAEKTAKEIVAAVRARIENEQRTATERATHLRSEIEDMGNSETVRMVAGMELKAIESKSHGITAEEKAAIETEIHRGRKAIEDAKRMPVRDALHEAEEEIKAARKECLGRDFVLYERWMEGIEESLVKMQE